MSDEKWGIGNKANEKPYATAKLGNETIDLISGEHPHSRSDNYTYAKTNGGAVYGFNGHRLCFKIVIEENNYLKTSYLSGDEIRKSCTAKLFVNDVQVYDENHRNYEACYRNLQQFIIDMEEMWGWFPNDLKQWQGRTVAYKEQLFKISRFVVDQGAMILETVHGEPRKRFMWEDKNEDYEPETSVKVSLTDKSITWFPKIEYDQKKFIL